MLNLNSIEIIAFRALGHGVRLSLRQLKRILRQRSLRRRDRPSDGWDVLAAIEQELSRSGSSLGYQTDAPETTNWLSFTSRQKNRSTHFESPGSRWSGDAVKTKITAAEISFQRS